MGKAGLHSSMLGTALFVGRSPAPSAAVAALAARLAPDPMRHVVVADAPNPAEGAAFYAQLAELLRGRGPVRLAIAGTGSGQPAPPAQWLADSLAVEIVAPDGHLLPADNTAVRVVHDNTGEPGHWIAFRPRTAPVQLSTRFPEPPWERHLPQGRWSPAPGRVVERIPAGVWLPGEAAAMNTPALRRPLLDLPVSSDVLTVAVGAPGNFRLPVEEFVALRHSHPVFSRSPLRLVAYAGGAGQALADGLGERVVTTTGLPVKGQDAIGLFDSTGQRTWSPFAIEMAYSPQRGGTATEPEVVRCRPPLPGLRAVGPPCVFEFGPGVLLEVVQSGLWLRGLSQRPAREIRARPADPNYARITVGVPGEVTPDALGSAVATLTQRLEAEISRFLRISVEGTAPAGAGPATAAPVDLTGPTEAMVVRRPKTVSGPKTPAPAAGGPAEARATNLPPGSAVATSPAATERVRHPPASVAQVTVAAGEKPPTPMPARVTSVPRAARPPLDTTGGPARPFPPTTEPAQARRANSEPAGGEDTRTPALPPAFPLLESERASTPEERSWLRENFRERYGFFERAVVGLIATSPALRLLSDAPGDSVVADLVSVRDYLADGRSRVDEALKSGQPDSVLPYLYCVASGLRRLPSFRGIVFASGLLGTGVSATTPGATLTERGIRQAVRIPTCELSGPTELVIWSSMAHRLDLLEPEQKVRRVAFSPGARFRVLGLDEETGPVRRVFLRQVPAGLPPSEVTDEDLALRDKLAAAIAERDVVAPADRDTPPDQDALRWHLQGG